MKNNNIKKKDTEINNLNNMKDKINNPNSKIKKKDIVLLNPEDKMNIVNNIKNTEFDNSEHKLNIDNSIQSKNQVVKNNYWNEDHEEILLSLLKSSFRLSEEYQKTHFRYKKRLQWYRIPIIIISAIGGFLSLSNSGYVPLNYNKWISLFVGFSNLCVTIISLIENFKKIDTYVNGSYSSHINFQKLHDEIAIIKRIPPNEREENGYVTIQRLFNQYETYLIDAPVLEKIIKDDLGYGKFNLIDNPKQNLNCNTNEIVPIKNFDYLYKKNNKENSKEKNKETNKENYDNTYNLNNLISLGSLKINKDIEKTIDTDIDIDILV